MNPIGYPKLHPVGSDLAPYERRSDRSGSQREPTCNRADRSECFVGPTLSRSTRSRGVDRARADRLHTLVETQHNYIVNLAEHTCTCSIWQSSGYPCGHAISILLQQKENPQRYVKAFFAIVAYKKTYEQPLLPLDLSNVNGDAVHSPPTVSDSNSNSNDSEAGESDADVLPPTTRRPPGRPKKRRIRGQHEEHPKRAFKCSRCNVTGHSRRTCREAINRPAI